MLEVTGLHVAYGGIQAVRSITFHVNEGETVALIGANGAGKTSTLKAISRVLDAVGGDVFARRPVLRTGDWCAVAFRTLVPPRAAPAGGQRA